jgi:hypothetical protein
MSRKSGGIDQMDASRRHLLRGAAGAFLALVGRGRAQAQAVAHLTVRYEDAGRPIASDFVGLSYESAQLAAGDYFSADNASALGLIRALSPNGVIRIGGNTSERTVWRLEDTAATANLVITPAKVDRLATALHLLGWKLIYGLNLARGTPQEAAAEAGYVAQAVGGNLLAFQIGNEPDGYGRWSAVRPASYDFAAFLSEWRASHAGILAHVPGARFAGPDVAGATDWVGFFAAARPAGLVLLTRHYYADGPAGAPHVTLAKLLRSDGEVAPVLDELARYGRAYHLPWRIAETNSVYDEGQPGVSDTLGAALWGLELMFQVAAAGAGGVNFHAGVHNRRGAEDKAYTPIARAEAGRYRARPLYYGMLMFARAAAHGELVPASLSSDTSGLSAFAVRAADDGVRICLINKNFDRAARVRIDPGRHFRASSMMRLSGGADATTGVTLGGAQVDEFGQWAPSAAGTVPMTSREIDIDMPAASAALLVLTP